MPETDLDTRADEGSIFWWWDDAVREANRRATLHRRRMSVRPIGDLWRVAPASDPRRFGPVTRITRAARFTVGGPTR